MKNINEFISEAQINEAEFCKPNDICYVVVNKDGKYSCTYLPYTGFGEGEELKAMAEKMAKALGEGHEAKEIKFKDLQNN